jgi:hypothetical protein
MKHNATKRPRGWRRRAMGALGALVIAGSALAVTASTAAATQACAQPREGRANTCLTITRTNDVRGHCDILIGIDIEMPRQDAQDLINASGGNPFGTVIMANDHDDPYRDTASLFAVPLRATWPRAGDGGLSAEFYTHVSYRLLDEDNPGSDEVYARIALYDPRYPTPHLYHSGIISGNYAECPTGSNDGPPPN